MFAAFVDILSTKQVQLLDEAGVHASRRLASAERHDCSVECEVQA
jgi:hypothetical protein